MTPEQAINRECSGCGVELTLINIGGYRCYCDKCVDAMPKLPTDGKSYTCKGKYPHFEWVS